MAIDIKNSIKVQVNKLYVRGNLKGQSERVVMYFADWVSALKWSRSVNKLSLSFKVTEIRGVLNNKITHENFNIDKGKLLCD